MEKIGGDLLPTGQPFVKILIPIRKQYYLIIGLKYDCCYNNAMQTQMNGNKGLL